MFLLKKLDPAYREKALEANLNVNLGPLVMAVELVQNATNEDLDINLRPLVEFHTQTVADGLVLSDGVKLDPGG